MAGYVNEMAQADPDYQRAQKAAARIREVQHENPDHEGWTIQDYTNFGRPGITALILDSSIAAAWCFRDEATSYTEGVLSAVSALTVGCQSC